MREVCQAIVDEYLPEVMNCPTTPQEWLRVSEKFLQKWNFPHTCGALDGKHIVVRIRRSYATLTLSIRSSYVSHSFANATHTFDVRRTYAHIRYLYVPYRSTIAWYTLLIR